METSLSSLKPQQTLTDGEDLEVYGLDKPAKTLTALAADGEILTLAFGKTTTDGNSYYVRKNDQPSPVYIISDELAKEMDLGIYDMCRLPDFPAWTEDQLVSIAVSGPVNTLLSASRNQGTAAKDKTVVTVWRSGGTNVTENLQVRAIVGQVLGWTIRSCADYRPSPEAVALCGFEKPDGVVKVNYKGQGDRVETWTLLIGRQTLDGDGRYVRINDDTTMYRMGADQLDAVMALATNGLDQ
jgi:hypothetical protein